MTLTCLLHADQKNNNKKQAAPVPIRARYAHFACPDRDGRRRLGVVVVAAIGGTCGLV